MQINKTDRISQIFDTIIAQLGGLNDLLDAMLCTALEERFARRGPAYLSPLARRLRVIEPSPLADLLDDAVDQGRLTEAERDDVMLADVVLSGQRRADRADVYYVVEVSVGVGVEDVRRAVERAAILAKLGRTTVPVVAGNWINNEAEAYARTGHVWQVLDGRTVPPAET